MNKVKDIQTKRQLKVVTTILLLCSLVIVITGLLLEENDLKAIMLGVGTALVASVFIMKFFKRKFGYKPTREEIKEEMFNSKNKSPFRG